MSLLKKLSQIDRTYANFRRYVEVIDKLMKFGFDDLLAMLNISGTKNRLVRKMIRISREKQGFYVRHSRPRRVRLLLQSLGPTFIKLGQVLASRPDLIPLEYAEELSRLQDNVPGFPGDEAVKIIEAELKQPLDRCFRRFDRQPFAAASIGQVHHAELPDGTEVVVKVQRPGIERRIATDLEIMYHFAVRLEQSELELNTLKPTAIVEEFSHVLTRELNYMVEATHARRFAEDMASQPGIFVPRIDLERCSARVLTMELVKGTPARKVLQDQDLRREFDLKKIADIGAKALMAQIFEYGFFHADPHPGNLFLMPDNRLCFIDFGMMGRISDEERSAFFKVVRAMLDGDYEQMGRCVLALATPVAGRPDPVRLERDIGDLVEENLFLPIDKLSLARILEQLMRAMAAHKLSLRPDLYVMFKALITLENVAREFDPGLKIVEILKETMFRLRWKQLNLRRRISRLAYSVDELVELGRDFPAASRKLLQLASEGNLLVKLEHHRLGPLQDTIRASINLLSYAVVLASLVIGSSLIVLSGLPPKWNNVPVVGLFGFLLSAVMGFGLLLRAGRKH